MPKSWEISERSQSTSFAAYVAVTYLLSVVDSEIIACRFALQETAPPLMMKAYPGITFLSSAMLPFASLYPTSLFVFHHILTTGPSSPRGI